MATKAKRITWTFLVIDPDTKATTIDCKRCGGAEHFPMPVSFTDLKAAVTAFNVMHRDCESVDTGIAS